MYKKKKKFDWVSHVSRFVSLSTTAVTTLAGRGGIWELVTLRTANVCVCVAVTGIMADAVCVLACVLVWSVRAGVPLFAGSCQSS